jgi:hypothetical protein
MPPDEAVGDGEMLLKVVVAVTGGVSSCSLI